jgi:serine/threonine-protein kinase
MHLRVYRLALIIAGGAAMYGSIDVISAAWSGPPNPEDPILMGLLALVSFGVAMIARARRVSRSTLMDLAFVYQVLLCGIISLGEAITSRQPGETVWGVSWVCVAMVAFPAFLPYRRFAMTLAAVMCALSGPVMYFVAAPIQGASVSLSDVLNMYIPNFISLGIAIATILYVSQWAKRLEDARRLGSYRLLHKIGDGGMGEVWQAEHKSLARPAAIKLVKPDTTSAPERSRRAENRFFREAQATAGLQSAHTITVYDYGLTRDGRQYYVMELLDGITLQELVTRFGPLESARVIHVLQQICESLGEAHTVGLIHRDIKPANVFLCQKGGSYDFVKVLDFGLVKPRHDPGTQLTLGSEILGTPGYTPPESIQSGQYDPRSDIYSLGCLAYYLLAGKLMFEGGGAVEHVFKHVNEPPIPITDRARQSVHQGLADLVMQCVEKRPEDRPADCDSILNSLESLAEECRWGRAAARKWWLEHIGVVAPVGVATTTIVSRDSL